MELPVQFLMLTLFLTTQLVVFPWNLMWIPPWNPYGIVHEFNVNSLEIPWNPHGLAHGMSMEWSIPYGFHMDSRVGME